MKWLFRIFFRTVRLILGPILLAFEWLTTPRGLQRSEQAQQAVDEQTRNLTLYQFQTCPFCIKTRRAIKRLSLNIELRDAQKDPQSRQELLEGGGEIKLPCLRIRENGRTEWMYESDDIIAYLNRRFGRQEND
jgi:glutaredoxin